MKSANYWDGAKWLKKVNSKAQDIELKRQKEEIVVPRLVEPGKWKKGNKTAKLIGTRESKKDI